MKIIYIGTDIEEVSRIKKLPEKTLQRVFTTQELEYCRMNKKNSAQCLAARFAAKEAAFKALPFDGIALKKIEVSKDKDNKPLLIIHDARAKKIKFKLSISHTSKYATAFVIAYEENK